MINQLERLAHRARPIWIRLLRAAAARLILLLCRYLAGPAEEEPAPVRRSGRQTSWLQQYGAGQQVPPVGGLGIPTLGDMVSNVLIQPGLGQTAEDVARRTLRSLEQQQGRARRQGRPLR